MIKGNINVNIDVDISKIQLFLIIVITVVFMSNLPAWLVYFKFDSFLDDKKENKS